ncbi:MAG: putative AEC-type transporter [Nitrospira sp.]|nr:putative AEC-type transporter [Nitrospira sp.]
MGFTLLFLGAALLRGFHLLNRSHAERLSSLVFSLSLPATIVLSLDAIPFTRTAWKLPVAACLVTLPMILVTWQLARILRLPRPTQGGFMLAASCINSIYFAYPVILATLGDAGLAQAILFDLGQTTLTLTVLYAVAVWYGSHRAPTGSALRRFLSSPPLWALTAMLLLKLVGLRLPAVARDLLMPLHLTTIPLASVALGLSISFSGRGQWRLAALGVTVRTVRMGGGFLFGMTAASLLSLTGVERTVVILVAGMPSAVTAVIFTAETGLDEDLVASLVALSLAVGLALLPWLPEVAVWLGS